MPKLTIFLVCEKLIQDSETNLTSIINLMDGITPAGFPFMLAQTHLFMYFLKQEGDEKLYDVILKIKQGEQEIFTQNVQLDFKDFTKMRVNLRIYGIPINLPGTIRFEAYILENLLNSFEVDINPDNFKPTIEQH